MNIITDNIMHKNMSKQYQQQQRPSRNSYFYNSVQAQAYTAQADSSNPQQRFYETHIKQSRNRGVNQQSHTSSQSNSNVPKTLSCVFQRNSSNKKSFETLNTIENEQKRKQTITHPIKSKSMSQQMNRNNIKVIKPSATRELQATDYHLFTSDEEMEKALSPQKDEEDLEATLVSFHNVRSSNHQNKVNRLHPQTIESFLDTSNPQKNGAVPLSCFNSGGKSSLKKNQHHNRGSSQKAKKAVSYLSDLYSLIPIHQKFTDFCSTSKNLFNQTQETLIYEPVGQQQYQPDFLAFKDINKPVTHKELKGRALSAASIIQPAKVSSEIARKLIFGSQETTDYIQMQQMRHQITQQQLEIKQKDAHIQAIEYQYQHLVNEQKQEEAKMRRDIESKEELINRMQGQIQQLLTANDQLQNSWNLERSQMMQVQESVSKVCQDQLQSFYELNKKSEAVIERLESELASALSHIEYLTTRQPNYSTDPQYLPEHYNNDLSLTQQTQAAYMDTYEQQMAALRPIQNSFEQYSQGGAKRAKKNQIEREKLIKQNTGIITKKNGGGGSTQINNKENNIYMPLQSRNYQLAIRPKSVNYLKQRGNSSSLQMNSMYSKALLALIK